MGLTFDFDKMLEQSYKEGISLGKEKVRIERRNKAIRLLYLSMKNEGYAPEDINQCLLDAFGSQTMIDEVLSNIYSISDKIHDILEFELERERLLDQSYKEGYKAGRDMENSEYYVTVSSVLRNRGYDDDAVHEFFLDIKKERDANDDKLKQIVEKCKDSDF